jgi:hypothetical protein
MAEVAKQAPSRDSPSPQAWFPRAILRIATGGGQVPLPTTPKNPYARLPRAILRIATGGGQVPLPTTPKNPYARLPRAILRRSIVAS